MRNFFLIFLLITVFITVNSYAASIKITNPQAGNVWYKGKTNTIAWTKTSDSGTNVKINIFRNSIISTNFITQLKGYNNGLMPWKIPAGYTTGKYYIRIKGVDSIGKDIGVHCDSGPFTITVPKGKSAIMGTIDPKAVSIMNDYAKGLNTLSRIVAKSKITIISPKTGDVISPDKSVWIIWKITGRKYKRVSIILHKVAVGIGGCLTGAMKIPNTGRFLWRISSDPWTKDLKSSSDPYKIKIITDDSYNTSFPDPNISATTGEFYISNNPVATRGHILL